MGWGVWGGGGEGDSGPRDLRRDDAVALDIERVELGRIEARHGVSTLGKGCTRCTANRLREVAD